MAETPFIHVPQAVNVLLIHNNKVEAKVLSAIINGLGFNCLLKMDQCHYSLEKISELSPHLIIINSSIEQTDPFQLLKEIKTKTIDYELPVIMLANNDDNEVIGKCYEHGADDVLLKPINPYIIRYRIQKIFQFSDSYRRLLFSEQSMSSVQSIAKIDYFQVNVDTRETTISENLLQHLNKGKQVRSSNPLDLLQVLDENDAKEFYGTFDNALKNRENKHFIKRFNYRDGRVRYREIFLKFVSYRGEGNYLLGLVKDVTDEKLNELKVTQLAYFDKLTGLPNSTLLELMTEKTIANMDLKVDSLAVLMLDLDLFSRINNSMGHSAGNEVLLQLKDRLLRTLKCISSEDILTRLENGDTVFNPSAKPILARLSADTFVVVLPNCDAKSAKKTAEKIQLLTTHPFSYRNNELYITASIGISFASELIYKPEVLIKHADLALHEVKKEGRNDIKVFRKDLVDKVSDYLNIQGAIRRALSHQEFLLYFQPKISIDTKKVIGFEALIRWLHPSKGFMRPDLFIEVAEEMGLIIEMGRWVIHEACKVFKRWLDMDIVTGQMSVNVSVKQFRDPLFVEHIAEVLVKTGLPAAALQLEVTEGVMMSGRNIQDVLNRARDLGVSIALDDFGTGYSSLSYLTQYAIDTIKIDRCFVQNITMDSHQAAIVSAVVNIANTLDFEVVAEGVETRSELDVVNRLGCDAIQGHYFSRPLPELEAEKWLENIEKSSVNQ